MEIKYVPFTTSSLGESFVVQVPAPGPEEPFDQLYGEKNALWKGGIRYWIYHSYNKPWREEFCSRVEEASGIERKQLLDKEGKPKVAKKKDKEGNPIDVPILETEGDFLTRVRASEESLTTPEDLAVIAQEVADSIPFAPQKRISTAKPTKDHLDAARSLLAAVEAGNADAEQFMESFESLNGRSFASLSEDGSFTLESVALAIRINEDRKTAERDPLSDFMS